MQQKIDPRTYSSAQPSTFDNLKSAADAKTLFDLSSLSHKEHNQAFDILIKLFENPLCQTIFDARLRCFSDYSTPTKLSAQDADNLILQLLSTQEDEQRIRIFFDFFAQFRPFPANQKYIVEVDIDNLVTDALTNYCKSKIDAIETTQDAFQLLKYSIATSIVSTDFCSTQTYDELMDSISQALAKPQIQVGVNIDSILEKRDESSIDDLDIPQDVIIWRRSSRVMAPPPTQTTMIALEPLTNSQEKPLTPQSSPVSTKRKLDSTSDPKTITLPPSKKTCTQSQEAVLLVPINCTMEKPESLVTHLKKEASALGLFSKAQEDSDQEGQSPWWLSSPQA